VQLQERLFVRDAHEHAIHLGNEFEAEAVTLRLVPDIYLALVIDNRARQVLGHRLLDLRNLYGLNSEA
jgi:hypothetical protein